MNIWQRNRNWILYAPLSLLAIFVPFLYSYVMAPFPPRGYVSSNAPQKIEERSIFINGNQITVSVADTPDTRVRGLSGREALSGNEGMLFIFENDGHHNIWMKDMHFSIDILWISSDGKIVDARESVSPETYPSVFTPRALARYVLELPAGFLEEYNVGLGDEVVM